MIQLSLKRLELFQYLECILNFDRSKCQFYNFCSDFVITKTCPCNKQSYFEHKKNENFQLKNFDFFFLIFAQMIDCGYTLEPPHRLGKAVLTSSHNLCFGAKIRKISIPLHIPVMLYRSGIQWDIHYGDMFF